MTPKAGTRIEFVGIALDGTETREPATIDRQPRGGYGIAGYYAVRFPDGGRIAVHESRFQIVGVGA